MIALAVEDLVAATTFYEKGMGLPLANSPPGVSFFNLNGTWLGLSERKKLADDAGVSDEGSGYRGCNLVHNVRSENEVDLLVEEAISSGATLIKSARKADWGGYHAYFSDLDGHLWEVAYNPFVWIGPADDG